MGTDAENAKIRAYRHTERGRAARNRYAREARARKREEQARHPVPVPQEQIEREAAQDLARHIRRNLQDRREKRCPECEKVLGWNKYYVKKRNGRPQSPCTECMIARGKAYAAAHPEHVRAVARAYRVNHPEKQVAQARAYRSKLRAEDAAAYYAQRQVEKQRRRAAQRGNGGTYTAAQWIALKARYGGCCLRCGKCEPEITLTVDHVVPLAQGGPNNIGNLQPLCLQCNSVKGARWEDYRNGPYARKRR